MSQNAPSHRRRNAAIIIVVLLILIIVLLLLLTKCEPQAASAPKPPTQPSTPVATQPTPAAPTTTAGQPVETLTPATVTPPAVVAAGTAFPVTWTGPDNRGDFVTIVRADATATTAPSYQETARGPSLQLTAPMEPGAYEVRYVTGRSRTILGRAPIQVNPVTSSVQGPAEVTIGTPFTVRWIGPDNKGDYVTIVAKGAPDNQYGSYQETSKGATLTLTAPTQEGDAELRYVAGQGRTVLARAALKVVAAAVKVTAPEQAIAGSRFEISWTGPNNAGDYLTVVPVATPDGQYANYIDVSKKSPAELLAPIEPGKAEVRYVTGQGRRVLARAPITIVAATVTLTAPEQAQVGKPVAIEWTGPNNPGDYITVVPKATADGRFAAYTITTAGSPLSVKCPAEAGEAEIRYMTGQGGKVLARRAIKIFP